MTSPPTIYVASWSRPEHHGPGPKITIMRYPGPYHRGEGKCMALTPAAHALRALKAGTLTWEAYESALRTDLRYMPIEPDQLTYTHEDEEVTVAAGSSLLCACSLAQAQNNRCHRVWVAQMLAQRGWRVVLDGEELCPT